MSPSRRTGPEQGAEDSEIVRLRERIELLEREIQTSRALSASQTEELSRLRRWMQLVTDRLPPDDGAESAGGRLETVYVVEDLLFDPDSHALGSEARSKLKQLAQRLVLGDEVFFVEVRGHADTTGPATYNLELGRRRAEAVRAFLLLQCDLPAHRVSAVTFGEERPLSDESSARGRARNRRVEVVVRRQL